MQSYCPSLTEPRRLPTREVRIGELLLGNFHPVRVQTMTTTDTMDTIATVEQTIRCIEAGAELVRITAPSKREAENLLNIRNELHRRGYHTPLVADIHFTPNAAEIAARIVEKVRVNPGNYVDKKKFEFIDYTDQDYREEIDRIYERFSPLVKICKEYGTAMRIGTNHGSLSDRIMSRYGDTPVGMVESAMEFLRIARSHQFHQIVLSMKSSNPLVMVQAYRLLVETMQREFGECYPLHLGVTEAGDGEDGRIKSAIGIGTLMEDGIGDTIRVSLTEDPEFEVPVCLDLVKKYQGIPHGNGNSAQTISLPYDPYHYQRRLTEARANMGGKQVPVVVADFSSIASLSGIAPSDLASIGYRYDEADDKWNIAEGAADYLYTGENRIDFALPGTLRVICDHVTWLTLANKESHLPLLTVDEYLSDAAAGTLQFVSIQAAQWFELTPATLARMNTDPSLVLCLNHQTMQGNREVYIDLLQQDIRIPILLRFDSASTTVDEQLIDLSAEAGALLLDGFGDGLWLRSVPLEGRAMRTTGRTYLPVGNQVQFLNNTAFSILQATRTRISKTEYISCPSCGRTLFDLQETTARIRAVTHHLKGVKIAIMGCIVNGPGEMADADFGYVGSGPGKITLYKGKEIVQRNVDSEIAVEALIALLKENQAWIEPPATAQPA